MFNFGNRKVTKQGGSFLISLPMQWIDNVGGVKSVMIEMDSEGRLIVTPIDDAQVV